jgi:hypothetical protein
VVTPGSLPLVILERCLDRRDNHPLQVDRHLSNPVRRERPPLARTSVHRNRIPGPPTG